MRARGPALIVAGAVALRLAYGPGHVGYDAAWALEWGRETLGGALPAFRSVGAPTPHPLANAVSLLLDQKTDRLLVENDKREVVGAFRFSDAGELL